PAAVLIKQQNPSPDVRRKIVEQNRQKAGANVFNKGGANFRKKNSELNCQICQKPEPSERQKLAEEKCQEAENNGRQKLVEQAFAGVRKEIAEQIYQPALAGQLKSFDCSSTLPKELPPFNWINLTIDFDSAIPFVRWRNESSCAFEHTALRFLKKDV